VHPLLETGYWKSPVFVQHLAVSVSSFLRHRKRYGPEYWNALREITESEGLSKSQLEALQEESLSRLLEHCYAHVPHYREVFRQRGLKPEDIRGIEDLRKLPLLDKETVRSDPSRFVADNFKKGELFGENTSGSTGTPLKLWIDPMAYQRNYAFYERRCNQWAGVGIRDRRAVLGGRLIVPVGTTTPPFWRYSYFESQLFLSSFHMSPLNLEAYVEELQKFEPRVIVGYPSSVYALAVFMAEKGLQGVRPRAVLTSSETLLWDQRDVIERQLGCKVYDGYGSAELVSFISECDHGGFHISPEFGIIEFLRDGEPVPPGTPGEMACTGLLNYAMPLIRYRIGDLGVPGEKMCSCGRELPTVERIEGRVDDYVVTKEGRLVGRLDHVFKGVAHVVETQIVQEASNRIRLLLVPGSDYTSADGQLIVSNLKTRLGEDMDISIEFVDRVPRTVSGKFRSVVSHVSQSFGTQSSKAPISGGDA
jgi:phenylacetate-CoA ligase